MTKRDWAANLFISALILLVLLFLAYHPHLEAELEKFTHKVLPLPY